MSRALPLLLAAAFIAVPAFAADQSVTAVGTQQGYKWQPETVQISVGEKVRWTNSSSVGHDIDFQDPSVPDETATNAFPIERTFTSPGTYAYRCTLHSPNYDIGMIGSVVVSAASPAPSPGATTTPVSSSPTPGATATPTGTPTPIGVDPPLLAPRFTVARASGSRRALLVRLALDRPGRASGVLHRNNRRFGTVRFAGLGPTAKTFRVRRTREGRRLRPGRYRLRLASAPGPSPDRRTLRARVK